MHVAAEQKCRDNAPQSVRVTQVRAFGDRSSSALSCPPSSMTAGAARAREPAPKLELAAHLAETSRSANVELKGTPVSRMPHGEQEASGQRHAWASCTCLGLVRCAQKWGGTVWRVPQDQPRARPGQNLRIRRGSRTGTVRALFT